MLINDAILQRGRYRVIRLIASIGNDCLYVAQDNVLFNEVILRETRVDVKKVATLYYKKVTDKVANLIIDTVKKWDMAGL